MYIYHSTFIAHYDPGLILSHLKKLNGFGYWFAMKCTDCLFVVQNNANSATVM